MVSQDVFVGVVAVATGLFVLGSAAIQSDWIGRFWISRHLETASNGSVSRWVIIGLGAVCSILGTLLLLGFFPGDHQPNSKSDGSKHPNLTDANPQSN